MTTTTYKYRLPLSQVEIYVNNRVINLYITDGNVNFYQASYDYLTNYLEGDLSERKDLLVITNEDGFTTAMLEEDINLSIDYKLNESNVATLQVTSFSETTVVSKIVPYMLDSTPQHV